MPWLNQQRRVIAIVLLYYLLKRRRRERLRRAERHRRRRRHQIRQQYYSDSDSIFSSIEPSSESSRYSEPEIDSDFSNDAQQNEEGVEIKQEVDPFDEEQLIENEHNVEIKEETLDTEIKIEPFDDENETPLEMGGGDASDCLEMRADDIDILVEMVGPHVKKQDTNFRQAISVKQRVAAALCYLETGGPFSFISSCLNMSKPIICNIIPEVCKALTNVLDTNMMPSCQEDWISIAKKFESKFNIPNCVGILVGRQIQKTNIGLILLIDSDHNILHAEVIDSPSNDFNFDTSELYRIIISNEINLPPEQSLSDRNKPTPYVFLADEGFPLTPNIMKRFTNPDDEHQAKFNEKLGLVDDIFEGVLCFMAKRFQVWNKQMILKVDTTKLVLKSTVCLYNFLRRDEMSRSINFPEGIFNSIRQDKKNGIELLEAFYTPFSNCLLIMENADDVRNEFVEYFNC